METEQISLNTIINDKKNEISSLSNDLLEAKDTINNLEKTHVTETSELEHKISVLSNDIMTMKLELTE